MQFLDNSYSLLYHDIFITEWRRYWIPMQDISGEGEREKGQIFTASDAVKKSAKMINSCSS